MVTLTKFTRILQLTGTGETIDMLDGTFRLRADSWEAEDPTELGRYIPLNNFGGTAAWQGYDAQEIVFTLVGKGPPEVLRASLRKYYNLFETARTTRTKLLNENAIPYLQWASQGEEIKQVPIIRGRIQYRVLGGMSPMLARWGAMEIQLAFQVPPHFERSETDTVSIDSISCEGGTETIAADSDADLPGRIVEMNLHGTSGDGPTGSTADYNVENFWLGFRPLNQGLTTFDPVWQVANDGSTGTDASIDADASAIGGNRVTVDFATDESMVLRASETLQQHITGRTLTLAHQYGEYLVLARMKVSNTDTAVAVQMRFGTADGVPYQFQERYVTTDEWKYYEVGNIVLPYGGVYNPMGQNSGLALYAERMEGSNDLHFDAFILIPSSYMCIAKHVLAGYEGIYGRMDTDIFTTPYESQYIYAYSNTLGIQRITTEFAPANLYKPRKQSVLVFVGELYSPAKGAKIDIDIEYAQRYRMWAGEAT